ncbi:hypothetical protein Q1695_005049 [Nippostrongylus brasiliensis]|nr:hypothetical protein Q1695_005049 [Nippostrongylus brasiliensis]
MLLESPPRSPFTYICGSPVRSKTFTSTFSATRTTRIPRATRFRVYPADFQVMRPRLITATTTAPDQIEKTSSVYKFSRTFTYFEQCFKILRQLGRGVFGEALEVECLEDGKRYAVKRALRTFETAGGRQQKIREAKIHESIPPHPNIIRYEKAWEERGRLYIQTELCGANLADYRLHFGVLNETELNTVLLDMLKAIAHMHSVGVVHMDVKPSNIFLDPDGTTCKLGDFGLAFNLDEDSIDNAEEGDRYYMAPEILNDRPTKAADIFSLGVTMLELSTEVNLDKDREKITSGNVPRSWFRDLSDHLIAVIKSMLEPDPLKRPSASDLLRNLTPRTAITSSFRHFEISTTTRFIGTEDKDWDCDIEADDMDTESGHMRSRAHRLSGFSRRLSFDEEPTVGLSSVKRQRLFD